MSERSPSLTELRARAQKGRHREVGNVLARRYARPSAIYGTWLAVRLGFSAHQVTLAALASSLAAAGAIGTGNRSGFVLGVALLHLAFWLDHVDGQVARWRGTASLDGVYFDYLMHHAAGATLGFALGFGLAVRTGSLPWAIAGFAIAVGWGFLSLHNDCRYKAFFQRLKSTERSFRVDGGSGGKPTPAARPPRHLRGLVVWAAYKTCENHIVLIGLSGLAGLALIESSVWETGWKTGAASMSLLAPMLAILRIARSIRRESAEADFARWFRPTPS
jgi:hypothetical protein